MSSGQLLSEFKVVQQTTKHEKESSNGRCDEQKD